MFWHSATGATLSSTVTVAVQVEVLPLLSVTVSVTVLAPTLVQSNVFGEAVRLAMPHASELLLLMSAPVMLALPAASS